MRSQEQQLVKCQGAARGSELMLDIPHDLDLALALPSPNSIFLSELYLPLRSKKMMKMLSKKVNYKKIKKKIKKI